MLVLLNAAFPVMIRTSWTWAVVLTPRKDRLFEAVVPFGTACHQSWAPQRSYSSIRVTPA